MFYEISGFLMLDGRNAADVVMRDISAAHSHLDTLEKVDLKGFDFDEALSQAILDLLRAYSRQSQSHLLPNENSKLKLNITNCRSSPFLDYLIEAVLALDVCTAMNVFGTDNTSPGDEDLLERQYQSLLQQQEHAGEDDDEDDPVEITATFPMDIVGFRMKFARQLRTLDMYSLILTQDHVESLMFGIETGQHVACHLTKLSFCGVHFLHGDTIQELCDGLPKNASLENLGFSSCWLSDPQMALIFDALKFHPTLTTLDLGYNICRNEGIHALERLLVTDGDATELSSFNQPVGLKTLYLGFQVTPEDSSTAGERLEIEALTNLHPHETTFYYFPLQNLTLSGNHLTDTDMAHIATLIRRFPNLKNLELECNDISSEGLEIFLQRYRSQEEEFSCARASKIHNISLGSNPITDDASKLLLDLYKMFPMLEFAYSNVDWQKTAESDEIQHMIDINKAGRVLLQCHQNSRLPTTDSQPKPPKEQPIALSVWPTVLARMALQVPAKRSRYDTNVEQAQSAANGLYHLVRHGPIFAGKMDQIEAQQAMPSPKLKTPDVSSGKKRKADPALGGFSSVEEVLQNKGICK